MKKKFNFDAWLSARSCLGRGQLAEEAYELGQEHGYKEALLDEKDAAVEAGWKERQGEEYGTY